MRTRLFAVASLGLLALIGPAVQGASPPDSVSVNWLGGMSAPLETGVSWGVPWPKGAVPKGQTFSLTSADGKTLPLQTWPLAYWPDGSLKWSGFATVAGPQNSGPFKLAAGDAPLVAGAVRVRQSDSTIEVDTGKL